MPLNQDRYKVVHLDSRGAVAPRSGYTRLTDTIDNRGIEKFALDRPGRIINVGHHLSTKTTFRCLIRTISLAGAELDISRNVPIRTNFFLQILGIQDDIGCTVKRREGDTVFVSFNMLLDAEFLHHVIRLNFEISH